MEIQTSTTPNTQGLHPIVAELLLRRGYDSKEEIEKYFSWNLRDLPDLTTLLDLEKAALRIVQAIDNKEQIGVYGDYDVDGTTSCALLFHFFQSLNIEIKTYQPSRFVEGYGVHPSSIDQALEDQVSLLITVDCGISNLETAEYTHDKNIDLIITDHHKDAKEYIPKAYAVINPNRRDEATTDEMKHMAGVGVAFCLCLKIKNLLEKKGKDVPSLYPLLEFVAIGTICDLAHLSYVNRILTKHGLKQIPKTQYPGLKHFLKPEDSKKSFLESERCSFSIGPHINSRGRLDHPEISLMLLTEKDELKTKEQFNVIFNSNQERKEIQNKVYEEANTIIKREWSEPTPPICIVYQPHWHEGVIGIVASKIVETFRVPAIVFTDSEEKGTIKASARTAGELDLFKTLDQFKELFLKFGGHKAAAGLSMKRENLPLLKERVNNYLLNVPEILRVKQNSFDLEISLTQLDYELAQALLKMEPFGNGNPQPMFRITDAYLTDYSILKDAHVRWNFSSKVKKRNQYRSLKGISFNYLGGWNKANPEQLYNDQDQYPIVVDAVLNLNHFNGRTYLQLMVERIFNQFDVN